MLTEQRPGDRSQGEKGEEGGLNESAPESRCCDRGADERGAENDAAQIFGAAICQHEGEGAGERFGDDDEVIAFGSLGFHEGEQFGITERWLEGIGDDLRGEIRWERAKEGSEEAACAIKAGE